MVPSLLMHSQDGIDRVFIDALAGGHSGADAEHDCTPTNQSRIRDRVQCLGHVTLREPSSVNFHSGLEFSFFSGR